MTKIKICGLSRIEDIEAVNVAKPDFIGFVFANSKRQINGDLAKILKKSLNPEIKTVGVFVNQSVAEIIELVNQDVIEMIQLHGDEDDATIHRIKEHTDCPIIQAIRIRDKNDIRKTVADYHLFDTYDPGQYGGSGQSFNWDLINGITEDFFLAGGLNFNNISDAIARVNPCCVDISSGVESNGKKDRNKIINIIQKIRRMSND